MHTLKSPPYLGPVQLKGALISGGDPGRDKGKACQAQWT